MSSDPPLSPAERFAGIIAMMIGMLGARLERPGKPGLAGPLTYAIYIRLLRIRNRIASLAARMAAGTLKPPRQRPATGRRRSGPAKPPLVALPDLPRGCMWLVRLVPGIGVGANHLRILLDDPQMQALIAAAPQIGRTLRPFWHMLSPEPLPPILQKPRSSLPAAPTPPVPPRPAPAHRAPPADPARVEPSPPLRDKLPPAPEVAAPTGVLPALA